MNRWTKSYPGEMKVVHDLGKQTSEREAIAAFVPFRAALAGMSQDEYFPQVCSTGYGAARRYYGEIHFSTGKAAKKYQAEHGGDIWYCIEVSADNGESDLEKFVSAWIKTHQEGLPDGAPVIKTQVVENNSRGHRREAVTTPEAYVYTNDATSAMLLKLALGGRA